MKKENINILKDFICAQSHDRTLWMEYDDDLCLYLQSHIRILHGIIEEDNSLINEALSYISKNKQKH